MAKAFCAGADFNMAGYMFSGYIENPGKIITKNGQRFKEFFGSSSNHALIEYYGKKDNHRAQEGRYTIIPLKGSIHNFIQDLLGSLRSCGTYIGAKTIKEFSKRATFIKVNHLLSTHIEHYENNQEN